MQIYSVHIAPFSRRLNKNKIYNFLKLYIWRDKFDRYLFRHKHDYKCIDIFMIQLYF